MDASLENRILQELENIKTFTQDTARSLANMEGRLSDLGGIREKTDANTTDVSALKAQIIAMESRLNRTESNARWAIGLVITLAVSFVGFIITVLGIFVSYGHKP